MDTDVRKRTLWNVHRAVLSESTLSASLAIQNVPSEESDQTAHSLSLIGIFAGHTSESKVSNVVEHI